MAISGDIFRRISPANVEGCVSDSDLQEQVHVLAVDDNFVDRTVIERLLKISCCKVTTVDSGTRALQFLGLDAEERSVGFDGLKVNLIMTDYSMPGMTGYELLKKIKESSTLKEIPVVIMSSEEILPRIDRCLEEGAEEFIVKPVKLSDVKRLKDFIMRGDKEESEERNTKKRKLQQNPPTQPLSSSPRLLLPSPIQSQPLMSSSPRFVASDTSLSSSSLLGSLKRPRLC